MGRGMLKRLAIFGGSFDPVHLGHLLVARAALEELRLDRVFFVPAARSPFKPESEPAPAHERLCMLRLALAGMAECSVDDQEVLRGGVSYTIETVRRYVSDYPEAELFWVIGADHLPGLPRWRDAELLARHLQFVVVPRPSAEALQMPAPFRGVYLRGFPLSLSSSEIRQRVREGRPIDFLTPYPVAEFIRKNRLYL